MWDSNISGKIVINYEIIKFIHVHNHTYSGVCLHILQYIQSDLQPQLELQNVKEMINVNFVILRSKKFIFVSLTEMKIIYKIFIIIIIIYLLCRPGLPIVLHMSLRHQLNIACYSYLTFHICHKNLHINSWKSAGCLHTRNPGTGMVRCY